MTIIATASASSPERTALRVLRADLQSRPPAAAYKGTICLHDITSPDFWCTVLMTALTLRFGDMPKPHVVDIVSTLGRHGASLPAWVYLSDALDAKLRLAGTQALAAEYAVTINDRLIAAPRPSWRLSHGNRGARPQHDPGV